MKKITLKKTKSQIVINNGYTLYIDKIADVEGLFRKDKVNTLIYGRIVCDYIKEEYTCHGFFTSDEIPKYGISKQDTEEIFNHMNKKEGDGDLLIICAYKKGLSKMIIQRIREIIRETQYANSSFDKTSQYDVRHNLLKILKKVS